MSFCNHDTIRTPTGYRREGRTDFFNLKSKAAGPRQYGYLVSVEQRTNPETGDVAYLGTYQTLLDGERYQSSKSGAFVATEAEAIALLDKTIAGALKRYAKLALNPASKIERR